MLVAGVSPEFPWTLGANRLATEWASYRECGGDFSDLGLAVLSPELARLGKPARKLLAFQPTRWVVYRYGGGCPETALQVAPVTFALGFIANDSLFLPMKGALLRFNAQLQTGSGLLGHEVFLMWSDDVDAIIHSDECAILPSRPPVIVEPVKKLTCIDKKMARLLQSIKPFYE